MTLTNFDVLVVYSHRLAKSAASSPDISVPFSKGYGFESYNLAYTYFLTTCKKHGLKAAFTTSADIIGPGTCSSYWLSDKGKWQKVFTPGYSGLIFDKISSVSTQVRRKRKLLFSSPKVRPFNSPRLFSLFVDKFATYKKLRSYSIPTVRVSGRSGKEIVGSLQKLASQIGTHANGSDFSDEVVLKDRFGAGGRSVYKFNKGNIRDILTILAKVPKTFIIQPFVRFDKGFRFSNSVAPTDIRLIFLNGKIIQTYLRIAKPGDFRCNEHRGGTLVYVPKNTIPEKITALAQKIAGSLGDNNSLFSLDFIISNKGNIYLLEGNTSPGLDWNTSLKANERQAKKLIRIIVKELVKRIPSEIETPEEYAGEIVIPVPTLDPLPAEPTFI